jgi:sec-independent protein translocase protein TatC
MKLPFRRSEPTPKVATPDDRMTLIEHLAELRTRIIRGLLAVVLGIIIVLAFYNPVLEYLRGPYERLCLDRPDLNCTPSLQFISPLEGFSTRLSISTYGGIILALPVLLWQVWRFVVPALHSKEKKYAIPFIGSSIVLFALGGFLAFWTLEKALEFLISWAGTGVEANFRVGEYVRLVGLMIAAFGIAFQFPVLLVGMQLIGVVTPQTLLKGWRYAILVCFVVAAVITPSGDPYSMLALALPMSLFYLVSVLIGWLVQRAKHRRQESAA